MAINIKAPVTGEDVTATHCEAAGAAQGRIQPANPRSRVKPSRLEDMKEVWARREAWSTVTLPITTYQTTAKDGLQPPCLPSYCSGSHLSKVLYHLASLRHPSPLSQVISLQNEDGAHIPQSRDPSSS